VLHEHGVQIQSARPADESRAELVLVPLRQANRRDVRWIANHEGEAAIPDGRQIPDRRIKEKVSQNEVGVRET
jgi:hypothetical protein